MFVVTSCAEKKASDAALLLEKIETLYQSGKYAEALDSIKLLRAHYPKALEERKAALKIWQNAWEKMSQEDIAKTDSALHEAQMKLSQAKTIRERNYAKKVVDSLQIRYETLCGTVRVVREKRKVDK